MDRISVKHGTGLGDVELAVDALKETDAVVRLDLLDGPGDGGLGHAQLLGGLGDVLSLIDGQKNFHMAERHGLDLFSC